MFHVVVHETIHSNLESIIRIILTFIAAPNVLRHDFFYCFCSQYYMLNEAFLDDKCRSVLNNTNWYFSFLHMFCFVFFTTILSSQWQRMFCALASLRIFNLNDEYLNGRATNATTTKGKYISLGWLEVRCADRILLLLLLLSAEYIYTATCDHSTWKTCENKCVLWLNDGHVSRSTMKCFWAGAANHFSSLFITNDDLFPPVTSSSNNNECN